MTGEKAQFWRDRRYTAWRIVRESAVLAGVVLIFGVIGLGLAPPPTEDQPWVSWWPWLIFGPLLLPATAVVMWLTVCTLSFVAALSGSREAPDGR